MPDNHKSTSSENGKKYPLTARRIAALIGIILLLALYGSTMVFALSDSPAAKGMLMASIFGTIAIPVLLYAMTLVASNLRKRGAEIRREEKDVESTVSEDDHEQDSDF